MSTDTQPELEVVVLEGDVIQPLTERERQRLKELERVVDYNVRGFLKGIEALLSIYEEGLWREYGTWPAYLAAVWGGIIGKSRAYQLLEEARVERVFNAAAESNALENGARPGSTRARLELGKLPEDDQVPVHNRAVQRYGPSPTGKQIARVAHEYAAENCDYSQFKPGDRVTIHFTGSPCDATVVELDADGSLLFEIDGEPGVQVLGVGPEHPRVLVTPCSTATLAAVPPQAPSRASETRKDSGIHDTIGKVAVQQRPGVIDYSRMATGDRVLVHFEKPGPLLGEVVTLTVTDRLLVRMDGERETEDVTGTPVTRLADLVAGTPVLVSQANGDIPAVVVTPPFVPAYVKDRVEHVTVQRQGEKGASEIAVKFLRPADPGVVDEAIASIRSEAEAHMARVREEREQAAGPALQLGSKIPARQLSKAIRLRRKRRKKREGAQAHDEWFTDPEHAEAAREVLGEIELDPASCERANRVIRAKRIFSKAQNGLEQDWEARTIFLNPPFLRLMKPFIAKLLLAYRNGKVEQAILLCNANTGSSWFRQLTEFPICLVQGRPKFEDGTKPEGTPRSSARSDIVFVYFGKNVERFARVFSRFGPIVGLMHAPDSATAA